MTNANNCDILYYYSDKIMQRVLAYRVQEEDFMTYSRPEYDMKVVGQNLKRLRMANHLSVEDVREYLCLGSVQAIYKYEWGRSYPQVDTMFALMELYGANLYDIIRDHEEDEQSSSAIYIEIKKAA